MLSKNHPSVVCGENLRLPESSFSQHFLRTFSVEAEACKIPELRDGGNKDISVIITGHSEL